MVEQHRLMSVQLLESSGKAGCFIIICLDIIREAIHLGLDPSSRKEPIFIDKLSSRCLCKSMMAASAFRACATPF